MGMKQKRLPNGRYRVNYAERLFPVALMLWSTGLAWGLQTGTRLRIEQVQAREGANNANAGWIQPTTTPSPTPQLKVVEKVVFPTATPTPTDKEEIIAEIVRVFGEEAPNAIKIMECESRGNPETIGDTHIMGMLDGELIGDSIGLFQIRTGDAGVYDSKPWNRAKANGMTVEEFRTWMKDPKSNVKYAKTMFDREGWSAWWNCMKKTGVK